MDLRRWCRQFRHELNHVEDIASDKVLQVPMECVSGMEVLRPSG